MAPVATMEIDGVEMPVVEVPFETEREEWNRYRLPDGTQVRVKVTVFRVFRVLDENGEPRVLRSHSDEEEPHVVIRHRVEILASPPMD